MLNRIKKLYRLVKATIMYFVLPSSDLVYIELNNYKPGPLEVFASHAGDLQHLIGGFYWAKTPKIKGQKTGNVDLKKGKSIKFVK